VHPSHVVLAHLLALLPQVSASTSPTTKPTGGAGGYSTLIFLVLIAVVAYFLLIRPQRNRAKQAQQMRSDIEPGVEVLTRHGQHATVTSLNDDGTLTLEIAPGVHSKFVKEAVARVLTPEEPQPDVSGDAPDIETIYDPDGPATGATDTETPETEPKPGTEN
jgi:preprotein translocase subunit YajC